MGMSSTRELSGSVPVRLGLYRPQVLPPCAVAHDLPPQPEIPNISTERNP